jgi:hypothetical protein
MFKKNKKSTNLFLASQRLIIRLKVVRPTNRITDKFLRMMNLGKDRAMPAGVVLFFVRATAISKV